MKRSLEGLGPGFKVLGLGVKGFGIYSPNKGGSNGKRRWNMDWKLGLCRGP